MSASKCSNIFRIEFMRSESCTVTDDNELSSGSRESNIGSSRVSQKSDFAVVVAPDHGDDDDLLFASLKTIDGINFKADHIQLSPQQSDLGSIRRDDTHFGGRDTGFDQVTDQLNDKISLFRIQFTLAIGFELFFILRTCRVNEFTSGESVNGISITSGRSQSLCWRMDASAIRFSIIKSIRGKLHDGFMHAVLNCQLSIDGFAIAFDQSLHQRIFHSSGSSLIA